MLAPRVGPIARARREAIRRRAMKRWLRAHGVRYTAYEMYSEPALRKKIRAALTRVQG